MLVVCISGTINAGKSTLGRLLAARLAGADFVDGDDHDAPADAPLATRIERAMQRLVGAVEASTARVLVLAYPLDDRGYVRLRTAAEARGARLFVVTLAPPLEIVLADRGDRRLTISERKRIPEMIAEGFDRRAFSDLIVSDPLPASQLADRVATEIGTTA